MDTLVLYRSKGITMAKKSTVEDILRATPAPALQFTQAQSDVSAIHTLATEIVETKARLTALGEAIQRDNQTVMIIVEFLRVHIGPEVFAREWAAAVKRVQSPGSADTEVLQSRIERLESILTAIMEGGARAAGQVNEAAIDTPDVD